MTIEDLKSLYKQHFEASLFGRYIHTKNIKPLLEKHTKHFKIEVIGESVLKENIYSITLGTGSKKVLMWSQMHGNESTTTKAIFDLLNFFCEDKDYSRSILESITIVIIPILNPDGAKAYTRLNANKIDLNRDAQDLTQPESNVLRDLYNKVQPDYCFNLHGQRTIFSAGNTSNTAALSFLSPAQDIECTITDNRRKAMSIIVKMNTMLQSEIPNKVGIYDDAFNINCVGDTFQRFNVPTVLFEAGHLANDYNREEVRRLIFQSYIVALQAIVLNTIDVNDDKLYLLIPENEKLFYDIIIQDVDFNGEILDVAIQYQEKLIENKLHFVPKVEKIEKLDGFYAHNYLNANNNSVYNLKKEHLFVGNEIDFVYIENVKLSLNIG
ncbi:M14 family zinc carboxypeptidase [uncultured Lacinutrix sp.]|uniref:M14 family zinc carboxypeptidase n=1 Tax=uncultured Lacinutrix sp. TaxID=574032 RepID=UPI002623F287|nr:M14 family zinc carboxypeptidase [uncultured Lacinutrix sp.]